MLRMGGFAASGIRGSDGGVRRVVGTTGATTSLPTTDSAVAGEGVQLGRGREFACHIALCRDCLRRCQGGREKNAKKRKKLSAKRGERKKASLCKNLVDNLLVDAI